MTVAEYNDLVREVAADQASKRPTPVSPPYQYQSPRPTYRAPSYELPSLTPPTYTTPPLPSSRTTYDWQSGDTYTTRKRPNGETEVSGDAFIAVGDTPIATFLLAREPDNPMTAMRLLY